MNKRKTNISNEPEVPKSKTDPTIEELIEPEKTEDTKAIKGKIAKGIKYLALGISTIPLERTEDKKTAKIVTRPVAKRVILATYKLIPSTGTKKTGKRNTKPAKIKPNFLTKVFTTLS